MTETKPQPSPANDALMGKSLAEAHRLLQESGYNFEEAHPECYRNFSYVKLFQLIEADRTRAQSAPGCGEVDLTRPACGQGDERGRKPTDEGYGHD